MNSDERVVYRILEAARKVHGVLGCGFPEVIYERALITELRSNGLQVEKEKTIRIWYASRVVGKHRLDLLVDKTIVVELKAISELEDIFLARTRSYLKALDLKHGLILNFATMPLTIKRVHREPSHKD